MPLEDSIGTRIRSARGLTSLSRTAFCQRYGISGASLKAWELSITSIRTSSLEKLVKAFQRANVLCSREWLQDGTGSPPHKLPSRLSSNAGNKSRIQGGDLFAEVEFFLQNNPGSLAFQIPDETMQPFYDPQDYVGGILVEDRREIRNNNPYILVLSSGDKRVQTLFYEVSSQQYILSSTNPLHQKNQTLLKDDQILEIYDIIWHRKA